MQMKLFYLIFMCLTSLTSCDVFSQLTPYFFLDEKVGKKSSQIANRQAFLCRTKQLELRPGNLPVRTDLADTPHTARLTQPGPTLCAIIHCYKNNNGYIL